MKAVKAAGRRVRRGGPGLLCQWPRKRGKYRPNLGGRTFEVVFAGRRKVRFAALVADRAPAIFAERRYTCSGR